MVKMIALYTEPTDREAFDSHYFGTHIPLVNKIPGLVKTEVNRVTGAASGPAPYYLMVSLYFNSKEEMDTALATPEGRATGKDLRNFTTPGQATITFAEVVE